MSAKEDAQKEWRRPWAKARYNGLVDKSSEYVKALEKRLHFLLPTPLAIMIMLALAFMATDFIATNAIQGLAWIVFYEIALCLNIGAHWRLSRKLHRLRDGRCVVCGYDLRATPEVCPECGTAIPK